ARARTPLREWRGRALRAQARQLAADEVRPPAGAWHGHGSSPWGAERDRVDRAADHLPRGVDSSGLRTLVALQREIGSYARDTWQAETERAVQDRETPPVECRDVELRVEPGRQGDHRRDRGIVR